MASARATVIVYCDASAHSVPIGPLTLGVDDADDLPDDVVIWGVFRWDDDGRWTLEPFSARRGGRTRQPHRKAAQWIAADGSPIALSGMDMERMADDLARAQRVAGAGDTEFGHRYQLRCPECDYEVRRSGTKLHAQLEALAAQRITAISLAGLNGRR
jgi:hypothetical protein